TGVNSYYPVAIRASVLKDWIDAPNDQTYRYILEELIKLGYIEGDLDDIGSKGPRLSKNIRVAKNKDISAYQFNFID
ncbi:hypothetical protein, partial [Geobacillus stearothermophilus]|uniref:hypothetical protein n=1 Tax=Geobacillus stearothermophilus TaxID=1422 RepID=UPI003D22E85F